MGDSVFRGQGSAHRTHPSPRPLLRYIARASRDLQLSEFRAILDEQAPTAEAVTMTIEEQLYAEGHANGLAEGKVEGKAELVLVILRARGLHV